jgi:protoporphyrinogen/coproporphyrinogen III oxidase
VSNSIASFPAVVIGGGISGLTCAYRLQQAGIRVCVLNAATRPGGMIATTDQAGFRFEHGPQSFLLSDVLRKLIDELGLTGELLHADPRAPRYILLRGKLVPAPLSPPSLLTTPLLDFSSKWRIFTEMARRTQPPAQDESIAAFVRRKFGDQLLQRLVAPFVSGIYAGDPERLSLHAAFPQLHKFEATYGSVLRGAMKSRPAQGAPRAGLCSFQAGMQALPRTLAAKLGDAYMCGTKVVSVRRAATQNAAHFEIDIMRDGVPQTITAGAVIVATPTYTAGEILNGISEQFPALFSRISYAPVAVISAGYRRDQIRHPGNGFGFLVPRGEGLHVLGTVWNSSLFPGSAPEGMSLFTSFAGGATEPLFCQRSEQEIAEVVCAEVATILGITGAPAASMVHRYERALPQYNLGHSETIAALQAIAGSIPGLFLAGNYLSGPAIGSCVEQANQTAMSVENFLRGD